MRGMRQRRMHRRNLSLSLPRREAHVSLHRAEWVAAVMLSAAAGGLMWVRLRRRFDAAEQQERQQTEFSSTQDD